MDQTALSPQFTATVTVLGVLLGTATLIYTVSKDRGIGAMRARAIENAKDRLALWEMKLRIQTAALTGAELEEAKMLAAEAAENVHRELNENLETLRVWTGPPTEVLGLPWWKRVFLLYKPIERPKWLGYFNRSLYLLSWVIIVMYLVLVVMLFAVYARESPAQHEQSSAYLVSKPGRAAEFSLGFSCLTIIWNGSMFYRSVRHEKAIRRFNEILRM